MSTEISTPSYGEETPDREREGRPDSGLFLAADPRMSRMKQLGKRVAQTDAPVLITGESGVGKEVLARFVHAESKRFRRPFVKINCAAVPHDLLESELFGHERGAFTGAHQRKQGKFELANGGTLLLDEIGDMDLALQAKLLHVLEDGSITRVGGNQDVELDVRIVATTNKPLEEAIVEGEFRKDLYFRLKVIRIEIPPLRERPDDIPLLCDHFLRIHSVRQDSAVTRIPDRMMRAFLRYPWPGNVRELDHVIQRFVILPDVEMVLSELETNDGLSRTFRPSRSGQGSNGSNRDGGAGVGSADGFGSGFEMPEISDTDPIPLKSIAAQAAEEAEKRVILQVLRQTRWNRKQAASRLDICYKTLLNKLERWDMEDGNRAG